MEREQPDQPDQALAISLEALVNASKLGKTEPVSLDAFSAKMPVKQAQGVLALRQALAAAMVREEQGISPTAIAREISQQFKVLEVVFKDVNGGMLGVFDRLVDEERIKLMEMMSLALKIKLGCPDIGECKPETTAIYLTRAAYQGKEKIPDQEKLNDLYEEELELFAAIIPCLDEDCDSSYIKEVFIKIAEHDDDDAVFICRRIVQAAQKKEFLGEARSVFTKAGLTNWAKRCDEMIRGIREVDSDSGG